MPEWSNGPVSKTGVPSRVPRVRIPVSPLAAVPARRAGRTTPGEVSEWSKEHAWKACVRATVPGVRIPPSPLAGPRAPCARGPDSSGEWRFALVAPGTYHSRLDPRGSPHRPPSAAATQAPEPGEPGSLSGRVPCNGHPRTRSGRERSSLKWCWPCVVDKHDREVVATRRVSGPFSLPRPHPRSAP